MSFRNFRSASGGARASGSARSVRSSRSVGYTGLEVISDGSSGSGDFARSKLAPDRLRTRLEGDRKMSEVSSYQSMSNSLSEFQISVDVLNTHTLSSVHERRFNHKRYKFYLKSFISTLVTFIMLMIGIILVATLKPANRTVIKTNGFLVLGYIIRAAGLFGFAGGVTNWIGIQFIFNKVPGLFCRGALAKKFAVSRESVANFMLEAFFGPYQVRQHVRDKTHVLLDPEYFEKVLQEIFSSDVVSKMIDRKLVDLLTTPQGLTLRNLGLSKVKLKTVVKRYILDMKSFASPLLLTSIQSSHMVDAEKIREQIVDLIATRTQQMTAEQVKEFVHEALYKHVLWVVMWGNVFGAIVGCIVEIASIYTRDLPW